MKKLTLLTFVFLVLVAACGGAVTTTTTTTIAPTATTTSPDSTTTTVATENPAETTTSGGAEVPRIKVEDGVKTEGLDTLSVRVGETVRFVVEADTADELHVHGYDITVETIPDQEVEVEFVADATGIFEVELHHAELHVLDIEVTP
jgi:heme/copper-type cytochrome/quinol oxidase subunit 2